MSAVLAQETPEPIGLLAGWGRFPVHFATRARESGQRVVCVGLTNLADPCLADLSWRFGWCGPLRLRRMIGLFQQHGVRRLVMAGKVFKADLLYRPWKLLTLWPDWRAFKAYYFRKRQDNRDDSLLLTLIDEFARDGLEFASALDLCPELLVKPGILTRRRPSAGELADVRFGWTVARKMGELDIGQSVAVKELCVLAVEAVEGTDQAILRAGQLCRAGGFTLIKVAKPGQDMRFDVPTVGALTIETIHKAGGRVLAVEAGKTILLDQEETVALANRLGISIVALTDNLDTLAG